MSLNASATAGAVPQQNWNNVDPAGHDSGTEAQVTGPNPAVISDNGGTATGLTLNYAAQGMWAVSQTTYTGNRQLLSGYSDVENDDANIGIYAISNISFSAYDVYVYVSSDANGRTTGVSLNGGPQTYLKTDANGYDFTSPLIEGQATVQGDATNAHYICFRNVTGSGFEVEIHRYGGNVGVAGIQIVDTSGYSPAGVIHPSALTLYAGSTAQFEVAATGTAPFGYQWRTNMVALSDGDNVLGATSNVLTISNLSAANSGSYDVFLTNGYGNGTTPVAQLTVLVPAPGSFAAAVVSNAPVAYYRFNETDGDPSVTPNLPAFDYIGGDNGIYGVPTLNWVDSIFGPQPSDGYPGFESGNGAVYFSAGYPGSQINIPSWNITGNNVTMVAWLYPNSPQVPNVGLIFNRGANVAGLDYSSSFDDLGAYTLGYTWNNDPGTYSWDSGLVPPQNEWSLVALAVTPTNATIYLANAEGVSAAVHHYPHALQTFSGPVAIGNDPGATDGSRIFNGQMDEVAVFDHALSQDQVLGLFGAAAGTNQFVPKIAGQPADQSPFAGQTARFTVAAVGTSPLGYQWRMWTNGAYVNLTDGGGVTGAQSPALVLDHVGLAAPTNFVVVVTNVYGAVTSSPAALTVTASSYASTVLAEGAVAYYALNETGDPSVGGLPANDYVGGFNGVYGTSVQNGFASIAGPGVAAGFAQFPADNWAAQIIPNDANGHIVVSPWNLDTNTVTFTCWINPAGLEPSYSGLIFSRGSGSGQAGLNFSGNTDGSGNRTLSYTWGDVCCWDSQLAPPPGQWSFVALVVTPTNAAVYVFNTNGTNNAAVDNTHDVQPFTGVTGIGLDPYNLSARNFDGVIDEVAVFKQALSAEQLAQLYQVGVQFTGTWDGTNLTLNWSGGILLQAPSLNGPWTTNNSAAPLTVNPHAGESQMFYHVQQQ